MRLFFVSFLYLFSTITLAAKDVRIADSQLWVNGKAQPQLFGAEIQYFRLRGGEGPNIPREEVLELWARALDSAVVAGMNTISFYIPWDFHEYREGQFDFTGEVDEDQDGLADYPSRDVLTFIRMIRERGIRLLMVRPGPYINAEWGFLGFGAIPLWFHEKYPDSHMQNSEGLKTKLYDYHSPDLLRHTRLWFEAVYENVISQNFEDIVFLQLDNETNFMWQSIYNHDYGPRARHRYQEFLRARFLEIDELNVAHGRNWTQWSEVIPPTIPGLNVAEDRAWYEFQDHSIYTYLMKLRIMWEEIGVREPEVIFNLAESYNAMRNGLLPNFHQRNAKGKTGMMSMNLYPKTYDMAHSPLMNLPFKADHDVKAMDAASDIYLGKKEEWLMGPEIQGGWWRSTPVSAESRLQTYFSTLGHGLKALYVYYFTEGDNWQPHWVKDQILPRYTKLRAQPEFAPYDENQLPHEFWRRLQRQMDEEVLVGIDVYRIMKDEEATAPVLFFDAPLDHRARPRQHFKELAAFGKNVIKAHEGFLGRALRVDDDVVIMKDTSAHAPSAVKGIDSVLLNAEWCGGLLGYLAQTGVAAKLHHWNLSDAAELESAKVIIHQDAGNTPAELVSFYQDYLSRGGTVISFLADDLGRRLGFGINSRVIHSSAPIKVFGQDGARFDAAPAPLLALEAKKNCRPILWSGEEVLGLVCKQGQGQFVQISALFYDIFNSDWYGHISDSGPRINFLKTVLELASVKPLLGITGNDQVTAFARKDPRKELLWLTIKSGRLEGSKNTLRISPELMRMALHSGKNYLVKGLMHGAYRIITKDELGALQFEVELPAHGSESFTVQVLRD